ncbi:hypothetical protein DFH09DRAFT_1074593 [Mycena vulgaris]|nr:hypothetical protein DFH09DRAFT_1074593 [Mycena vulgaris]
MNLPAIIALCLISSTPASCTDAALPIRDDPSLTVSLSQPSLTSTQTAVIVAYRNYSQKCGTDLNTATQAALKTYENVTSRVDTSITDAELLSWASTAFPVYMQASQTCQNALLDYQDTLSAAGSSIGTSSLSQSTAVPSSAPPPLPSSSPPAQPSTTPSTSPQPSPSKPASAAFHGPSWALVLAGLAAVSCIS